MAKRFFFIAAGIFLLVAAYQLGARRAEADWSGDGFVVATASGQTVWNSLGEAYDRTFTPLGWLRTPEFDLPVPAGQIKLLDGSGSQLLLVTDNDEVWAFHVGWSQWPPVPGGAVTVEGRSFGATKAKYR